MTFRKLILTATIAAAPVLLVGQGQTQNTPSTQGGLDPATIGKPLADSWPTYSDRMNDQPPTDRALQPRVRFALDARLPPARRQLLPVRLENEPCGFLAEYKADNNVAAKKCESMAC